MGNKMLTQLGFRPYRSGSTEYWFRPPNPTTAWVDSKAARRPHRMDPAHLKRPLVFCHGIGVGPTMCLPMIELLANGVGKAHAIFLVDNAAISMKFSEIVPSARAIADNIVGMLEVWGFKKAHFVGHSFGTFMCAWMLRFRKEYVERISFIDPVCFLLLKVLVHSHAMQQVKSDLRLDTMAMGIKYFVLTELFVCNYVCRNFFWEECVLDMSDLEGYKALLVLESADMIVPTHCVQRLALAERHRRLISTGNDKGLDILWVEDQPHAGFLMDAWTNYCVSEQLQNFHLDEAP
eukprot:TRINITY_DN18108_c0_g1_i2.p1 TRINITY_DN18108_c0_g1~~TRINITY_DN18108_c0_g1_i2.p1  ORF type:complete len:292 (-),score=27.50 TRINITY_DN18108_c0_g1_i2:413-1288(-)